MSKTPWIDGRCYNGVKRARKTEQHYQSIMPMLLEWESQDVSQEEMAEQLNDRGLRNFEGGVFSQSLISTILKRYKMKST